MQSVFPLPSIPLPVAGAAAPSPAADGDAAGAEQVKLIKAAEQFESLFIAQMFKQMRQAADAFGDGGEQTASAGNAAVLDHAYWLVAEGMSTRHAFGIADCLIAQMRAGVAPATSAAHAVAAAPAVSPLSSDPSGSQP